jgi:hypothetical protein
VATSGQVGKIGSGMGLSKGSGLQVGVFMNGSSDKFLTCQWGFSEVFFFFFPVWAGY